MKPELADAVGKLLAAEPGESSSNELAERATRACEQLARHFSRLVGNNGIRTLFDRCLIKAGAQFPWLAQAKSVPGGASDDAWSALRTALEHQDPDTAREAFVHLLVTFIGLLERLIGEGLVERLLHEVWPAVFLTQERETT